MNTAVLKGKAAIITGANQGLGHEIARVYAKAGASIMICARDVEMLRAVEQELSRLCRPGQAIRALQADVSDAGSVEKMVEHALQHFGQIDILVNNAGIYGPMGAVEEVSWKAWIHTIEINLFGSVQVCKAVLPFMKRQRGGKIIQLSGGGATSPMPMVSAYAVSKAAVVRFTDTLAEEVREFNIDVNAIAPGALNTRMLEEVLTAGPERVGKTFFERAREQKASGGAGLERGAALALFLASAASNGITGKLISAIWDRWEDWPEHTEDLRQSDVYTLRRIAGKDRGFEWGDR
jgi:NAD(P)-dependent dehydrogenase (short-subunit alcohol dehydrogenase family)